SSTRTEAASCSSARSASARGSSTRATSCRTPAWPARPRSGSGSARGRPSSATETAGRRRPLAKQPVADGVDELDRRLVGFPEPPADRGRQAQVLPALGLLERLGRVVEPLGHVPAERPELLEAPLRDRLLDAAVHPFEHRRELARVDEAEPAWAGANRELQAERVDVEE